MQSIDLDDVLVIEAAAHASPWPKQVFVEELGREWAHLDVVRERDESGRSRVVAFCNYWLVRDEVHLLNIATHPDRRRSGHARRLMDHLMTFADRHACRYLTLEVRKSNQAAIALYEHYGFRGVGVRPRYYIENREDAIVMTLERDLDS